MSESGLFFDYSGMVDCETINHLLIGLKKSKEFQALDKTTGKRLYAIIVESLENIIRHSTQDFDTDQRFKSHILVCKQNNKILIKTGNPVPDDKIFVIGKKIDIVNQTDDESLAVLYEEIINKETRKGDNCAGLGFILMKLKSGNKINYSFTPIDNNFSFFEINILLNKYIMRKLFFEKTDSSPTVILDPDKNIFEISGESRPPDVGTFYGEILKWMDEFSLHLLNSKEITDPVVFNFDLIYFNSSSAKYILDFCKQLTSVVSKGRSITVRWKYEADDQDMLEAGKEMSRIAKLPFEYVMKEI